MTMAVTQAAFYDVTLTVTLTGQDGNAYFLMGRVQAALRRAGASDDAIRDFVQEASETGDMGDLLHCVEQWVNVEYT